MSTELTAVDIATWVRPGNSNTVRIPAEAALTLVRKAVHGIKEEISERTRKAVDSYYASDNLDSWEKFVTGWSFRPLRRMDEVRSRIEALKDKCGAESKRSFNQTLWKIRSLEDFLPEVIDFYQSLSLAVSQWEGTSAAILCVCFCSKTFKAIQPYQTKASLLAAAVAAAEFQPASVGSYAAQSVTGYRQPDVSLPNISLAPEVRGATGVRNPFPENQNESKE